MVETSTLRARQVKVEEEKEEAKENAALLATEPRGDNNEEKRCSKSRKMY